MTGDGDYKRPDGTYSARKRWDDLSCVHRNWRGSERLRVLHGYARSIEVEFAATTLDSSGVVVDFSSMKAIKGLLEGQFDHTVLVAHDDPLRSLFEQLRKDGAANVRFMDDPGLEGSALWVAENAAPIVDRETDGRVALTRIEVRESPKNAVYLQVGLDT